MPGKPEGKLLLIGLGPGDAIHQTPAAANALSECDVLVGYRGYIDQLSGSLAGKELVSMELGQEMERAARAVDLASEGRSVAVVSSGDAGIYGMAGPVFRVLTDREWDGLDPAVEVSPGISALQSAASLLGAPLMQDFCAISLSNLLTPWKAIERRLQAAALGDFVAVLYNPRSRRRTWQLPEARRILMERRDGKTPVGLVRNAYRPSQQITLTDLDGLASRCEDVDMFTTVVIGNSTTYQHRGLMITPRGYEYRTGAT
nr:precorrin-3B methylase [uncultured bacterium]